MGFVAQMGMDSRLCCEVIATRREQADCQGLSHDELVFLQRFAEGGGGRRMSGIYYKSRISDIIFLPCCIVAPSATINFDEQN